jgi:ubiquinone/menaquinone biosynthesis C-methylase UbiE
MSGYIFDNAAEQPTTQRFASLEALYDPRTIRFLEMTGVGPGWQCLEVGGGSGSIATWLADRVGDTGHLLVTDIDPRFLATLSEMGRPNVEVRRHDVGTDPLPERAFDLIHARLVLVHVPTAPKALARLAAALRPGGWLVVEDFDPAFIDRTFPTDDPAGSTGRAAFGAVEKLIMARGAGRGWAHSLYQRLVALGLEEVGMEGHFSVRPGSSAGALLDRANMVQVRDAAVASGQISSEEMDRMLTLLDDPTCAFSSQTMFTAWGRRASEAA